MLIVADALIPELEQTFGQYGEVVRYSGRELKPEQLQDAKALLVRSVTQVNADLLQGSSVEFVGSCTIGLDHMDTDYCDQQGIVWANAPGCNANAVSEYVLQAILTWCAAKEKTLAECQVGIVGFGNVGSQVKAKLEPFGVSIVIRDPFVVFDKSTQDKVLQQDNAASLDSDNSICSVSLETILKSDIVTLHVPLSRSGEFPTHHLLDAEAFAMCNPEGLLINTSRGSVIDNVALKAFLQSTPSYSAVLDVFEHEPVVDRELVERLLWATPHIAGHSQFGKFQGTWQVWKRFVEHFELPFSVNRQLPIEQLSLDSNQVFNELLELLDHSSQLSDTSALFLRECYQANDFSRLRKEYRPRLEYSQVSVASLSVEFLGVCESLGFKLHS